MGPCDRERRTLKEYRCNRIHSVPYEKDLDPKPAINRRGHHKARKYNLSTNPANWVMTSIVPSTRRCAECRIDRTDELLGLRWKIGSPVVSLFEEDG